MFRRKRFWTIAISILIALSFWVSAIVYETTQVTGDSTWRTITWIIGWCSPAFVLGTITQGVLEGIGAIMVLAGRMWDQWQEEKEQRRQKLIQEAEQRLINRLSPSVRELVLKELEIDKP